MQLRRAFRSRPYGPRQLPTAGAIGLGVAVTVIAAAGGWALAAHLTAEPSAVPEARPMTVRLGSAAELSLRPGWKAVEKVPALPGLAGAQSHAFAPTDGGAGRMVTTLLPGVTGEALPRDTAAALRTPLARTTQHTTIGGMRGAGYTALALKGVSGIVDVYAIPTAAGVLTVACVAPLDDPLPVGTCPADIVSVAARKPPTPDPLVATRAKLPALVTALNRARRAGRSALRSGATSKAQARAAGRVAAAYRDAAKRAAAFVPKTGTASTLPRTFQSTASAYEALQTAATRHSKRAWRRARVKVNTAEKTAEARLDAVRAG